MIFESIEKETNYILETSVKETARDYSIDLIRVISMFLVLSLHCMYYGGLYHKSYALGGVNIYSMWFTFLHSLSSISVNLFILISGYFLNTQKFKISKLIRIVCEVVFYSWILFALRLYFGGTEGITLKMVITALLPVTYVQYWFVSAYVALYVLSPVLNLFIRSINQRQHFGVIVVLVCLFSVLNTVLPLSQVMGVRRFGQSVCWFVVLYIIGAFIRKYIEKHRFRKEARRLFWLSIAFMNISWFITALIALFLNLDFHNEKIGTMLKYFFMFDSVPVLIASVTAFHWLRGITITNSFAIGFIGRLAPYVFGVYLIHCNYYIRTLVWTGITDFNVSMILIPIYALLYTFVLYLVCAMIDYLRSMVCSAITSVMHLNTFYKRLDGIVYVYYEKAYSCYLKKIG